MANINFNVPSGKLPRIVVAMQGLYPIPTDDDGNPSYTPSKWVKEAVRRLIIRDVRRWEQKVAVTAAQGSIGPDDGLLS